MSELRDAVTNNKLQDSSRLDLEEFSNKLLRKLRDNPLTIENYAHNKHAYMDYLDSSIPLGESLGLDIMQAETQSLTRQLTKRLADIDINPGKGVEYFEQLLLGKHLEVSNPKVN